MTCSVCKKEYTSPSLGGAGICPSCDCGIPPKKVMTTKQSPEQSSSDPLDGIMTRYTLQSNVRKGDEIAHYLDDNAKQQILDWHLQKSRSYLPARATEYFDDAGHETFTGWNDCLDTITKRIEGMYEEKT